MAEIDEAGDAKARIGHAAGDDRCKMLQLRLDIDGDAMEGDPALQADTDGGDLVLVAGALVRPPDPDPDAILAPLAADVEGDQRPDDPFLETCDIGADIGSPALQVEHHIGDPLARPMIGDLTSAPGGEQGEARVEQVARLAAGSRRIER